MKKAFETLLIMIGVFVAIFCLAYFADVFKTFLPQQAFLSQEPIYKLQNLNDSEELSRVLETDIVSALMLEVNSINNILTWGSFLVGVLTIVAAVFGIAGFVQIKNNLENQLANYTSIFDKAESLVESADEFKQCLFAQQLYIKHSNESLFLSVYTIANQIEDPKIANELINQQLHSAHIVNLYLPSMSTEDKANVKKNKLAALLYLHENGNKDDIKDLDYVSKHDKDPEVRHMAQEVKIRIENNLTGQISICSRINIFWQKFKSIFK